MQLPIPVGPNPSLPSPVGPLSGLIGIGSGGGGTIVGGSLAADVNMSAAAFASLFGAIAAAAGRWSLQAGLFVSSSAAAAGGIAFKVISAGATGQLGVIGPAGSSATLGQQWVAAGIGTSGNIAAFDCSAAPFAFVTIEGGFITTGSTIDLQWENVTPANNYIIKAGSWIILTKLA
jgi:hypothetical protein